MSVKSPLLTCMDINEVSPKFFFFHSLHLSCISPLYVKSFLISVICVVSILLIGVGYPNKGTSSLTFANTSSNCSSSKNSINSPDSTGSLISAAPTLSLFSVSSSIFNVSNVFFSASNSNLPTEYLNPDLLHNALIKA